MSELIPPGLQIPPGTNPMDFYLQLPAMKLAQIPPGSNTMMTTSGPGQVWFLVVAVTCIAIPAIFLMVRVYTRIAIFKSLEPADYFLFLAFPLIVVEIVMGYYMVKWGSGVHQWQVTLGQIFNQLFWANTAQVIYCPLSFLVKIAILLQYLRLFAPHRSVNRAMWYGVWLTIAATFIVYTIFMFWTLFYCSPRRMIWFKLTNGHCHDAADIILSQGAFNMASDVIIVLLPVCSLWQLKVPLAKKVLITLLFGTGLLACVASAMRIVFTMKISSAMSQVDVSYNGLFIALWTEAEVSLGFIVACSLCLPKLIQAKREKIRKSLSCASAPFTSLSSKSRKSLLWSGSRKSLQAESKGIQEMKQINEERQMYYEVHEEWHGHAQTDVQPNRCRHDIYVLPSTARNSEYSQNDPFNHTSDEHDGFDAVSLTHQVIPRSISVYTQEVPVRLDPANMSPQELEAERRVLQEFNFDTFRVTIDSQSPREMV